MNNDRPDFIPPFPPPHATKASLALRFLKGWKSWIHVLSVKSYEMKMGHVPLPGLDFFVLNDAPEVEEALNRCPFKFPKHPLLARLLRPLLGDSIFTTNGQTWRRQRRMMTGAFAQTRLTKVFPLMAESTKEMAARVEAAPPGHKFHVDAEMTHVTADVIFRTILSRPLSEEQSREVYEAFTEFQERTQKLMVLCAYGLPSVLHERENKKPAARIRAVLAPLILARTEEYRAGNAPAYGDILEALLEARDEDTGEAFTDVELTDHVSMLFLAGHETSASALTWAIYILACNPDVQERLAAEAEAAAVDGVLTPESMRRLPGITEVFKETLRLYPPVGFFMREAAEETQMRGKRMRKGSAVMVAPWLLHRCPRKWEAPNAFRPERFRDGSIKEGAKDFYIPFGSGPRVCIGSGFATQEALLVLAEWCRRWRVTPVPGLTPEPAGRVTVRPDNGVYVYIRPRLPQEA